jgi:hypothetical protein
MMAAGDVDSGPEKGAKIPELKVYVATGDNKEKTLDLADAHKEKLAVYLIVGDGKLDRPMNQFIKGLDDKLAADFDGVAAVGVFPTDDEDKMKMYLPRVQNSVNYSVLTLNIAKGADGPKDWNINSDAHLTVIVADKGKVVARYGYKSVNAAELPPVLRELAKHVKKK